jgi:hypothetical protein
MFKLEKNKQRITMKKVLTALLSSVTLTATLFANEIQVSTSNTMHIPIDKNSKVTPLYFGPAQEFFKNRKAYLEKLNAETSKDAATYSLMALGNVAQGVGTGSSVDLKGGAIGLASVAVISLSKWAFDSITADYEYLFLNKVVNSDNQETYIYTMIVANDSITEKEASKIAVNEIEKMEQAE